MDIYYAALQISAVITYAGSLSFALYPKLLAERRGEDVTASLKTVLMFALPMTVGAIVLSSSYIVLLRPGLVMYPGAEWVLVVLALDGMTLVLYGIYGAVLSGVETVDQQKLSFKSLLHSKLFRFYSLYYVHSAITIPSTYYVLTTYAVQQPLAAALSVCAINTTVRFAMLLILIFMVRGMFKVSVPWRSIAKYGLASAVMGIVLYLLPSTNRISTTLAWTAVGGIAYLAVLMAIDKEARSLPKDVLREIRGRRSK